MNLVAASAAGALQVVASYPRRVREIAHQWIPLSDGVRLAARIWLPEDAEADPVPAVLEYIPYRKRDFTAQRDALIHPYFAGHGYACLRVDLRGSGDSEGRPLDEYVAQEQDDALEVLRWIANQPWCTGDVGMIGISWGGFNGLQVAARRPAELKAVITICSTDDRYADDIHFMGGCLLRNNLTWGANMFTYMARPPDPELVGAQWRDMWQERLESIPFLTALWLEHQRRDAYWRHGSVCEDYGRITCPVFAVGGWADGYSNAIFRLLDGLKVPRKGLVGPWGHAYPHLAVPGPAIDFLREALRWWDRWLKGLDTGIDREPMLQVWMQDAVPPAVSYDERPGRWIALPAWPAPGMLGKSFALNPGTLDRESHGAAALSLRSPMRTGLAGGEWNPHGIGPEMPDDQRVDDAGSLVFDTAPLSEPMEILGAPEVTLELTADQPQALIAMRLCDLAPSGESTRVTYGLLNLTHRDGHAHPEPLVPEQCYRVKVKLNDIAYAFPTGHRLRLAISTSYWPLVWPSPESATLTVYTEKSRLELPVLPAETAGVHAPRFFSPTIPEPPKITWLQPVERARRVLQDVASSRTELTYVKDDGVLRLDDIDLEIAAWCQERQWIVGEDPLSSGAEMTWRIGMARGDWRIAVWSRTTLTATSAQFLVDGALDAYEGDQRVFARTFNQTIARDLV